MAKDQGATPTALRPRAKSKSKPSKPAASVKPAAPPPVPERPKKRVGLAQFVREVRAEGRKVTWTSWRETWITSVMVFVLVVLTAIFFFAIDGGFSFLMNQILKLGNLGS